MKILGFANTYDQRIVELTENEFKALHKIVRLFDPVRIEESIKETRDIFADISDVLEFAYMVGVMMQKFGQIRKNG